MVCGLGRCRTARGAALPAGLLALALLAALRPAGAAAHETRLVGDGRYQVEVGFLDEPAYLGQRNALYLDVFRFAGSQPVEGLAATLTAEVSKDGRTMPLALIPQVPGVYHAPFFPTAVGDYTFRLTGTIEDVPVDESFTSSPDTFDAVRPLDEAQFPVQLVAPDQLALLVDEAEDEAAAARALGITGLAAGVLGLLAGLAALVRSLRRPAVPAAPVALEVTDDDPDRLVVRRPRRGA